MGAFPDPLEDGMSTPYQLLGGESGVRRLSDAFYDCMDSLPEAADIRRMHGADLAAIREKLYEYLSGWLGGPHLYAAKYGSMCMTAPHRPYAIGPKERDQWLLCMDKALAWSGSVPARRCRPSSRSRCAASPR